MKNIDKQTALETKMYRDNKSFGKEDYCKRCWACYKGMSCIASSSYRHNQLLCVKALARTGKYLMLSPLMESIMYLDKRDRHRACGLKRGE